MQGIGHDGTGGLRPCSGLKLAFSITCPRSLPSGRAELLSPFQRQMAQTCLTTEPFSDITGGEPVHNCCGLEVLTSTVLQCSREKGHSSGTEVLWFQHQGDQVRMEHPAQHAAQWMGRVVGARKGVLTPMLGGPREWETWDRGSFHFSDSYSLLNMNSIKNFSGLQLNEEGCSMLI